MSAEQADATILTGQADRDIRDLHALGYRQSLRRTIGQFTSFALGFAMVSITAAIFTAFSTGFVNLGGASIWLWIPVLIGVMAITLVYGHLSARMPLTGYAYQWSARLVNGHMGWFTGWSAMLAFTAGTAGLSIAMGSVFAPYVWNHPTTGDIQLFGVVRRGDDRRGHRPQCHWSPRRDLGEQHRGWRRADRYARPGPGHGHRPVLLR